MKISFHGAAKEVTGSCNLIETDNFNFLVDCGMFQGLNSYNKNLKDFDFDAKKIDFVLLTHAHLDHIGRIPKLYKAGFRGKIYTSYATKDLASIILWDLLRICLKDGRAPMFSESDLRESLKLFQGIDYDKRCNNGFIDFVLRDAGHVLGSGMFEVFLENKKIVFSGDLGNDNQPIVCDTYYPKDVDVVVVESTYGGRLHGDRQRGVSKFLEIIKEVIDKKGVLLIPSFSLERTQEIIYYLNDFVENKKIESVNVFLDSPLAIKATRIYEDYEKYFDKDAKRLILNGDNIFDFNGFSETEKIKESLKIIKKNNPKIIIAGSGMCSAGRMPYYLKHYLGDKNSFLCFISYQAEGTLGRQILENMKNIKINDKFIKINARIEKIDCFSSHADSEKLKKWIENTGANRVFINHGEEKQALFLKDKLKNKEIVIADIDNKFLIC